ncbi:hypothetical protein GF312_06815 [Candidatus Poribacteria bacterium]|nr:hypothetical protein [Candidatus Poribacteria bacterium]
MAKKFTIAMVMVLSLAMLTTSVVYARGFRIRNRHVGLCVSLTDEQRELIQETVKEMWEDDATIDDIREAVTEILKEEGVEITPCLFIGRGRIKATVPLHSLSLLTKEQRDEVRMMVLEMREDGATRSEIREAVVQKMEEFGIEFPLTEEQREEIREMVKTMREDGATLQEIRNAVKEKLDEYDVEAPENADPIFQTGGKGGAGLGWVMGLGPSDVDDDANDDALLAPAAPQLSIPSTTWGGVKSGS